MNVTQTPLANDQKPATQCTVPYNRRSTRTLGRKEGAAVYIPHMQSSESAVL